MTDRPAADRAPDTGPLPGAIAGEHFHGLESWFEALEFDMVFWVAPPATTAVLEVEGDGMGAAELQWSTRCAELPSTRAVVLLDGPGFDGVGENFETAHEAAEQVARFVTEHSGEETGPIEVLVFRPDTSVGTTAPGSAVSIWPQPVQTTDGAEFRFRHHGGARIRLTLTIPTTAGGD